MAYKFASAQNAPSKDADKSKETPADKPGSKPDEKPTLVTPAPKS